MRATDYLFFVVIIGLIVGIITLGTEDFNKMDAGVEIDVENLTGDYDKVSEINTKVNSSLEAFQTLGDEDASWFSKVSAGIVAIPKAVIGFPIWLMSSLGILATMIANVLSGIVPPFVTYALLSLMSIMILRRFMEFFQRARA